MVDGYSVSSVSSDCVSSTSDCRLTKETGNYHQTTAVTSTTGESNFEENEFIKDLIVDIIP